MRFPVKRVLYSVSMFLVPMFNGSSWASEIDDDILLFAPAKTSAYIPYNLTQVAVYLEGLLDQTEGYDCLLYTSPSPRDRTRSRMPSSA